MGDKETRNSKKELKVVNVVDIEIWDEANVRNIEITEGIDELAENINQIGLQNPPIVHEVDGKIKLISGQRRLLAVKQLGWKEIPVLVIKKHVSLFDAKLASISENIHRKPLNPSDLADVCDYLYRKLGSVKKAAKALGVSEPTFRKYYGYLAVPEELRVLVNQKIISRTQAQLLCTISIDIEKAVNFAKLISGLPRQKRNRYFAALVDAPDAPLEMLEELSERYKYKRTLKLYLPDRYARALGRASTYLDSEPESLSLQAIIDWLDIKGWMDKK